MSRKRDYRAEEARRNQLARARGFRSRAEERKFTGRIRNREELYNLPLQAQQQRTRSLRAISAMRENPRLTIEEAAALEGTTPEAMKWHVDQALTKKGGKWQAAKADRLLRPMFVNSGGQVVAVDVRGSRKASELSRYHSAVRRYLATGDESQLIDFEGKKVAGVPYETSPAALEEMARRNQLDIESIYQAVA